MNKTQLVDAVAQASNLKKKEAEAAIHALTETIVATLASGEKVQIAGFGTFEVKEKAARIGRNPKTGEAIRVEASKNAAFTASKVLKDSLN